MKAKGVIHFNAEDHRYTIDGIKVDSVTQILQNVGIIDFSHVSKERLEAAATFGTYVHLCTELCDKNDLDYDTLDPKLLPYVEAWIKFKVQCNFEIELIEQRICSTKYMYAGTIDRVGILNGKDRVILDIKSGSSMSDSTAIQTGGYMIAYNETFPKVKAKSRLGVLLKPDGNFKLYQYTDKTDCSIFLASLTLNNYLRRKK